MSKVRRFALDEITIRPGTYFNPQTEVLIVVDDSPEVDHEIFERDEFEGSDWVLISEDSPLDENKRDELVERFQLAHPPGDELTHGDDEVEPDVDGEDLEHEHEGEEEDDDLDGADDLELDHE
jgi:cupin superfamily acireductone dioxygenase involved in methionine salvage